MKNRYFVFFVGIVVGLCEAARVNASEPVMLQYFEAEWDTIRHRTPDVFMAGYGSLWLPPPQRGNSGTDSAGYDLFDRFDLGSELDPTRYGTESDFRQMIDSLHAAYAYVYVDWIMNHNGFSDKNDATFTARGGYPGFTFMTDTDPDGDFNAFSGGCPQSQAPQDPCYDLFEGRLLGLIDIAQQKDHQFIRHPTTPGDPNNIPAGTVYNQPDPANVRFYPDTDLPGQLVSNPGTTRNPGVNNFTFFPYNTSDPTQGDAVLENANDLLLRSTQYYLEVLKVDGFRLDAAKHIPTWFWDNLWDSIVSDRWTDFDGTVTTPFSFVEAVESNFNMRNWVRRAVNGGGWPPQGASFGNRDALDLNEAGQLRDIVSADGSKSWDDALGASIDNEDDGFNNGSLGVHHVNSHDNTIADDENDTVAFAYAIMRTGIPIVYHNALQFGTNINNFPRENGRDDALGLGSSLITDLVKIRNQYGRGFLIPINNTDPVNQSRADVFAFTRQTPGDIDNVLVAVNDLENPGGVDTRNVATNFPNGTRLHELTGNADDPIVDPNNQIPNLLLVDANGRLTHGDAPFGSFLQIPRNRNANGVFHGRGYVIYGPAVPTGTLSIANATTVVVPPDSAGLPDYIQRVNPITIVRSTTFDIQLQTVHTDPLDPNTDDLAVFRIDQGFQDNNGNGGVDHLTAGTPTYGFEDFLTENSPRFTGGTGTYRQTINAAALGEGYHYVTVRAFRHRPATADPLFGEFRIVIYVDLEDPEFVKIAPTNTCDEDVTSSPVSVVAEASDATVERLYVFLDELDSFDFVGTALSDPPANRAARNLNTFTLSFGSLSSGNHRVDIVAIEELPDGSVKTEHKTFAGIQATTGNGLGPGDLNEDGNINGVDIRLFLLVTFQQIPIFAPTADINCDGLIDSGDIPGFVDLLLE